MHGEIPNVVRYLLGLLVGLIYGISFSAMHYSSQTMPGLGIILFTTGVCFAGWALMAQGGLRKAFSAAFKAWSAWKDELEAEKPDLQIHPLPVRVQK
jgi:hypothetical protein